MQLLTYLLVLGHFGFHGRPAKDKLRRRSQKGFSKNGTHLGRGRCSSRQQPRMESECGMVKTKDKKKLAQSFYAVVPG